MLAFGYIIIQKFERGRIMTNFALSVYNFAGEEFHFSSFCNKIAMIVRALCGVCTFILYAVLSVNVIVSIIIAVIGVIISVVIIKDNRIRRNGFGT
jgi:hypothetical protein